MADHWLEGTESVTDLDSGLIGYDIIDGTSGSVINETGNYPGINNGAEREVGGIKGNAFSTGWKWLS